MLSTKGKISFFGRAGENFAGLRPHQSLQPDGRDAEGGIIGAPEQFGFLARPGVITEIERYKFGRAEIRRVAVEVDLREAPPSKVIIGESWHAALGFCLKKFDGGQ